MASTRRSCFVAAEEEEREDAGIVAGMLMCVRDWYELVHRLHQECYIKIILMYSWATLTRNDGNAEDRWQVNAENGKNAEDGNDNPLVVSHGSLRFFDDDSSIHSIR